MPKGKGEQTMKPQNVINITLLVSYCIKNNLCTGMSIDQYNRLQSYAANSHAELTKRQKARDIACMIKICSDTVECIEDLQQDILEMFYK